MVVLERVLLCCFGHVEAARALADDEALYKSLAKGRRSGVTVASLLMHRGHVGVKPSGQANPLRYVAKSTGNVRRIAVYVIFCSRMRANISDSNSNKVYTPRDDIVNTAFC